MVSSKNLNTLNPTYLKEETLQKVRKSFQHSAFPAVILQHFFSKEYYPELRKKVLSLQFRNDKVVIHHSYASAQFKLSLQDLDHSLAAITKKKIEEIIFTAHLMSWKDYMILNDRYVEKTGIDLIIDLSEDWNDEWGGVISYTDGSGTVYPLSLKPNSAALVERKKGMHKYIQYVNHYGKGKKRIFLIATL